MIKKKVITLVVIGVLLLGTLFAYLLVLKPLLKTDQGQTEELLPLLDGEVRDEITGRVRLFPKITETMVKSIEDHNQKGSFTFHLDENSEIVIKGMEQAPYTTASWVQLVSDAGSTLAIDRLARPSADKTVYGFGKDTTAWYEITVVDGTKHKVWIGDEIPTGGGYYVMYDGRDAVYVLNPNIGTTLLADVYFFIDPLLVFPIPQAGYSKDPTTGKITTIDNLNIVRDGKTFIKIDALTADETGREDGLSEYVLLAPAGYQLDSAVNSELYAFFSSLSGSKVVAGGLENDLSSATLKALLLEEYGISLEKPAYMFSYDFGDVPSAVFFSTPDDTGNMYAYSLLYRQVVEINLSAVSFLKWDMMKYIKPNVFAENIYDVAKVELKGSVDRESLSVDTFFTLSGDKDKKTLTIRHKGSDKAYDKDAVANFKNFYMTLVGLYVQGESDVKLDEPDRLTLLAEITITQTDDEVLEYKYYYYNSRRCLVTINGEGEFYVYRDQVEKLLRDADRLLKGLPVDYQEKN